MLFLLNLVIFRFQVNFQGCNVFLLAFPNIWKSTNHFHELVVSNQYENPCMKHAPNPGGSCWVEVCLFLLVKPCHFSYSPTPMCGRLRMILFPTSTETCPASWLQAGRSERFCVCFFFHVWNVIQILVAEGFGICHLCIYRIYIYIYTYVDMSICIYIYKYIFSHF